LHADQFLRETAGIAMMINHFEVDSMASALIALREAKGRVFVIGLGGSYSNAEHCAADLRKLCDIEAYSPNAAELTAWANDAGAASAFNGHLKWMGANDALLVLSVGGGTVDVSPAICEAVEKARLAGRVFGIVGEPGGITAAKADVVIKIPSPRSRVTPHAEAFQAVIWHCLVSLIQRNPTKW
jgi:D-sedoheptulose 7-phosphate isomerase